MRWWRRRRSWSDGPQPATETARHPGALREERIGTGILVLEHLRAIRRTLHRRGEDLHEIQKRLGPLEAQHAGKWSPRDRMDGRVARNERRRKVIDA